MKKLRVQSNDSFTARVVNMSLDISALDTPSVSSTLNLITENENVDNIIEYAKPAYEAKEAVTTSGTTSAAEEPVASTSAKKQRKESAPYYQ